MCQDVQYQAHVWENELSEWEVMRCICVCRYEKRHTNIAVHLSPCFRVHDGDTVIFGQCR